MFSAGIKIVFVLLIVQATLMPCILAISCAGCVDMDVLNFDKTVVRFPFAIVKFDIAFPYGEKHEAFTAFSKAAHKVTDDLLVGTVGIKDYGEMENKELGERFKVNDKNFPGIFLFQGSVDNYKQFPSHLDVTLENLKSFVSDNTDLYIGREGCLKEFNLLSRNYANLDDKEQAERTTEAEAALTSLTKESEQTSAKVYITFMQRISKTGYTFVEEETSRLQRLRAGKVNEAKKKEIQEKINILDSFRVNRLTKIETPAKEDL